MDIFYLVVLLFLFVLAVFDLSVGVANDAVNFLSPAVGAKAAKFRTILIVAAVGIFVGATTSSGMMDIARHGIFTPNFYSFNDVMCIFLAVAATDVILMDISNTLGMWPIHLRATHQHRQSPAGHHCHFPFRSHRFCLRFGGDVAHAYHIHFQLQKTPEMDDCPLRRCWSDLHLLLPDC